MLFSAEQRAALVPQGILRATINVGNPMLASQDAASEEPTGVSVDLARALAECLGVGLELLVVEGAASAVAKLAASQADVGFFGMDPDRARDVQYTAPYLSIDSAYLVRSDSPLTSNFEVDRAGTLVLAGKGSACDLLLTRQLQQAQIVRAATSTRVVDEFLARGLDVAAGIKQQLDADARRLRGVRLLPGRFAVTRQALATSRSRDPIAVQALGIFSSSRARSPPALLPRR